MNQDILKMFLNELPDEEIKQLLELNDKDFFYQIKTLIQDGYNLQKISNDKGVCYHKLLKVLPNNSYIKTTSDEIKLLVISDMHFCNKYDNVDYLKFIYDYALKNNIHIILNLGDLIEGLNNKNYKDGYDTYTKQVNYLLDNYPYNQNIINYILYGNHDVHSIIAEGIDISKILEIERPDFINVGYGFGKIKINYLNICMYHKIQNQNISFDIPSNERNLILKGHSHHFEINNINNFQVNVPTLSNVITGGHENSNINTGFLEMTIKNISNKDASTIEIVYYDILQKMKRQGYYKVKI